MAQESERETVEITSVLQEVPAALRRDFDALEATELSHIRRQYSRASSRPTASVTVSKRSTSLNGWAKIKYIVSKFWKNQISMIVDHDACRDHLALERTFLGYLRTSLAMSMLGVAVAQLFRLQHAPNPDSVFGFYVLGKPLACICQGAAIYSLSLGAYRSWRLQHAMVRGKAITGGFEVVSLGFGVFIICLMFFVLLIAVDIISEMEDATRI